MSFLQSTTISGNLNVTGNIYSENIISGNSILGQEITDLQTATGVLRGDINNNDSDISALQTATGVLRGDINNNDSDISALQTATGVLRGDINNNDSDISALQTATGVLRIGSAGITIDGGGSAITSGIKGDARVNYNGVITNATLLCDQVGTIELDIWKDSYTNFPPTVADSIVASNYPNTSSAAKYEDSTLTSWTTSITSGDVLRFVVNNNATSITRAHLVLTILKT